MLNLEANEIVRGTIEYATVIENKKGQQQLEIKVNATEKLLGEKPEDGVEKTPPFSVLVLLHLDNNGENSKGTRQAVARDQIARLTGVELETSWEAPSGWLRLLEDHEESLIPQIVGKEVMVRGNESEDKTRVFANLYWPRAKPKALTVAQVKEKFRQARPY